MLPLTPHGYWRIVLQASQILTESHTVIALRLSGMAGLWPMGQAEADRMVAEKLKAGFDSVEAVLRSGLAGGTLPEMALAAMQPVDVLLPGYTEVCLDSENAGKFLSGVRRRGPWVDCDQVVVYGEHPRALLGTAHVHGGELIPGRLLSPIEIQQILEKSPVNAPLLAEQV
mgnify:CR=1 FL=1